MYFLFFASVLALAAQALGHSLAKDWKEWKSRHGKFYSDESEEALRRSIWLENTARIQEHNDGLHNFTLSLNQFADMTEEEFGQSFLFPLADNGGTNNSAFSTSLHPMYTGAKTSDYPDRVDWRQKGFVTAVKNQGTHCARSSWAFSATGAIEGQYYRNTGQLVSLSEQQLIDCSCDYGNAGCHGGHMVNAFKYIVSSDGICKDADYAYLGYKWHCMSEYCEVVASCVTYTQVKTGSEIALLDAIYRAGPISVGIDATNYHFQFYNDGVYAVRGCNSHSLNHGMLLVGYGVTYDGIEYWIVKNSWGTSWGDRGYMKIARNQSNMCGIATAASYPTIKTKE